MDDNHSDSSRLRSGWRIAAIAFGLAALALCHNQEAGGPAPARGWVTNSLFEDQIVRLWGKAAEHGFAAAIVDIGDRLYNETKDRTQAAMWYRLAVTIGMKAETMAISIARSRLASMIAGGEVAGTPEEVAALLRDNAEAGFGAAAYAQVLLDGRGTPRNVAEGVLWLARTARAGDDNVAQTLADGWADGRFGAVDVAQSERWRAWHAMLVANNGLPMSTIAPPPGPPPPLPRGIDSRLDALCDDVAAGRALGFIHLGAAYERGQLVPVDYARAEYWYTRAAAMGSPTARWALGAMIVNGFRAGTDGEAAVLIAEGTAGRGITDGEAAYGWILMTGRGLPRDETEAVYWMRRAARHGDPFGEYLLGIALLFGHGIARDEARGLALIEQAADDGYVGPLTRPLLRGEAVADPW